MNIMFYQKWFGILSFMVGGKTKSLNKLNMDKQKNKS